MKFIFIFIVMAVVACNNPANDASTEVKTENVKKKMYTWPKEDEQEYMEACVENSKKKLGDTAAYSYCNCILKQVKETYPNMDSAEAVLMDSSRVLEFVKNCK